MPGSFLKKCCGLFGPFPPLVLGKVQKASGKELLFKSYIDERKKYDYLANKINSKLGYSKQESKEFVDFVFNRIIDKVALKEVVKIPKLGNFYLR